VESIQRNVDVKIKMVKTFKALLQIDEVEHTKLLTKNTSALEAWQATSNKSNALKVKRLHFLIKWSS